ncbi:MAG: putative PEP-CTERM system TPR-repeat lipoprotein [Alphaproteobacteria bacterium]|jgi:putative PEP-CTERM system TPR-repeat lipoprotein
MTACQKKTSEEYMQEAAAFAAAGNNPAAVVALKNAVQQDIRSAEARFELGKLYLELRDFTSAEKELSRAKDLGYPENEVVPLLALALQKTGANVALADLTFIEAELSNSDQMEVGFRKVRSLMQLNQTPEANALISDLLLLDTNDVYKGLVQAYQEILDEKPKDALATALAMYERAPLNSDVLNFTARLYMINGEAEEAANIYESYIKVEPKDLEAKFSLANMLVEQRQPIRAEKYIDELLEIIPENPLLNQLKGVVRAAASDFDEAKLYSEKAISAGRSDPALRLIAGFSSYQLQEYEAAVRHLSFIASILPDNHPGLRILAASQLQGNLGDDAGEVLARINDVTTQDASLFSRAGYELIKSGNTEAAQAVIDQADKISESSEDLTRLGILKLSMNDVEGLVDLESAVDKAPDSITAKTTLASAYLGTKQLDKAMALAKQWQEDEPTVVDGYLLESEVLQRQERFAEASIVITKASALDSNSVPVKLASIRQDLRQKKLDSALTKTEALLEIAPYNLPALASYFALKNDANDAMPAIDKIRKAVSDNPDDANLGLLLARITLSLKKPDEALDALKNIKPDRQAPPSFWQIKGFALTQNKQNDEALKHYAAWAELFPNQEKAVMGQLLILESSRAYEAGARIASSFVARKDNLQIKIMQSYFMVMAGDVIGSKEVIASIDDKYQPLPFLRGVKARIALAEGRGGDAVEDALLAYESAKSADNLFVYVRTLDLSKQSNLVLNTIEKHVEEFPADGRSRLLLAERQISLDPSSALAGYEALLIDFPNNFVVLNNAAHLLMVADNLDKASEYSSRAFVIQPKNVAIGDTHAQILLRQGNAQEALEVYNSVMNDKVSNEEISLNYIEVLFINNNMTIAERRIKDLNLTTSQAKARLADLQKQYAN